MDRTIRYEIVSPLEESVPNQPVPLTVMLPPENDPQGETAVASNLSSMPRTLPVSPRRLNPQVDSEDIPPPKADFTAPPPYELATKLPTYEEVQREKLQEEQRRDPPPRPPSQPLAFLAIDTDSPDCDSEGGLLGTDFMFCTAFLVAFLFNWIGFLMLMCFCHTIAARYGALSGFGLSLAKWTLIVKHSTDLASRENSWLWWLIMAFGKSPNLRSCHNSVPAHKEGMEAFVQKCSGEIGLLLLRPIIFYVRSESQILFFYPLVEKVLYADMNR
ncbi:hypothetical protein J437_LFUL011153 [Ladona fulva]|uniref:NEDD4 family-interacting protein 1-like n=1 Tax=Ladona fulva TaxID=123851 RepID=A0A8K0NYA2_LADFU|nr:hypothetical protein J437_LFUL011153 [Ladona fulva]